MLGGEITEAQRLEIARDVADHVEDYGPGTFPERPVILQYSDGQLHEAWKGKERGDRQGKEIIQQLQHFATWRCGVWKCEQRGEGNVLLLTAAINQLCEHNEPALAQKVCDYIRDQYGHEYELLKAIEPLAARESFSRTASQRLDILPQWLRTMEEPPAGKSTRGNPDDDYQAKTEQFAGYHIGDY